MMLLMLCQQQRNKPAQLLRDPESGRTVIESSIRLGSIQRFIDKKHFRIHPLEEIVL